MSEPLTKLSPPDVEGKQLGPRAKRIMTYIRSKIFCKLCSERSDVFKVRNRHSTRYHHKNVAQPLKSECTHSEREELQATETSGVGQKRGFSLGSWLSNVQSMFYSPAVHHERPRLVATVDADGRASYWDPKKKPINIQEPRIEKFIIVNVETTDATVESPWTFLPHLIHYASDVPVHPNKTKALLVLFSDAMAGSGMGSEFEDKIFQVMTWLYCAVIQWKQAGLLHCILNEKKISDTLARISDEVCKMTSQLSPPSMTSAQLAISLERDESHLLKTIVNVLNCKKQVRIVRESGPQGFTSIRESVERFRLRWKTAMAAEQVNGAPKFMRFFLICQRILSWLAKHIVGFSCPTTLDGRVKIGRFFTGGGGGDIYTGSFDEIDKVALKTSRSYRKVNEANTLVRREAMLWDGLCHPNILPMLGVANKLGLASYMVSPWVRYGNAKEYLQSAKGPDVLQLLLGIARGVEYIHNQQPAIVHGDLKLANILITQSGRPLISDFGSSQLWRGDDDIHFVEGMGTTRWMSPEYIISGRPTIYSDMYAFGMVILEVISGDIPFCDVKRDSEVALKVMKGERPERPKKTEGNGIIDNLWPISERCWDHCSKLRPTTHDLVQELHLFVRPV